MDLGKWLRDRKDQAVRQWQDSVVLDAVSSGTKADNDRRANQGTAETVRQRASQSYGNGFSGVMNRARDVVDADTPADWIKRQANSGLFETYQEQQNRLTNEAVNSQTDRTLPAQFGASGLREMGKFFLKAPGSIANMYGAVAQSENPIAEVAKGIIPGLGVYSDADKRMGHAASQDLQRQANDLNKQIDQKINQNDYIGERQGENKWAVAGGSVAGQLPAQIATGGAGLVNTGVQMASDEYNKAREAGRSNDQALGIGTLQGAASAASEKFGIDKFLPGNGVAGNSVIKVLKRFGTEGGQEAQQQFTQNLIANKTYDPNQGLKDGVFESAIFGGIAGSAMSPIADLANIGTTPNTPTQLTPEVQNKRNNLANAYTTLVDQGRPDQAAYFAREIDQIDNPAPGTLRERIRSAKDMIMPKGEGGYAKNPFYRGDDVAGGLSKEQSEFINDYANMLEGMGAGNGVDITPDGRRISNNVRDASTAGKTMSKQDWFDKARKDIESGKAGFGASDEYKKLTETKPVKPKNIENPKPVKSDPLESLKQEARKYKSAEEFVRKDKVASKTTHTSGGTKEGNPQSVKIVGDKIVVTNRRHRKVIGKYELPLSEWENLQKSFGNPNYNIKQRIKAINQERFPQNYEDIYNSSFIDRLEDNQISAIKSAYEAHTKRQQLTDLYNQATQSQPPKSPIESLKQEAKPATGARSDYSPENLQANRQIRAKNASSITYADKKTINPDELVTVYRAVPGKAKGGLVEGDWVTPNKEQARLFMKQSWAQDDTGAKIVTKKVKASELRYHADDAKGYVDDELLYVPKATQSQPSKSPPVQKVETPVESKTFVVPKTNPTDITKLSEKDLEYYGKKGYTAITDKYGNTRQITPVKTDGIQRLDSLNPTGGVSVDYSPKTRATMPLADNMTTYDKTSGKAPGEMVTIYRGAPKNQKGIVAGDFITTNQELAKSYTGDGNVLEMQVPASHILDDKTSPLGEEYLYRPPKKPFTPISQPVDNLPAVVKQVTKAKTLKAKPAAKKGVKPKGDELTPKAYANTFGITEAQAEQEITFNAATRTTKGKDANKLIEAMKSDKKLSDATRKAQESGKELNFYAKKDANGRSVGIETFNPKTHSIEAGFVVDEQGNVLGNHIKVDETGVQVNVGGDLINMDSIIGNPLEWGSTSKRTGEKKGKYKLSETMSRNIDNNAPTPEIANTTKRFLWSSKVKAEANMRTELDAEFTALDDRIKRTNKARPSNVSKEQYKDDIFATLNGDKTDAEIEAEYNPNAAQAILTYKKETRTLYDSLLKRINAERVKFGQEPITPRKDYITHLQEMNQNKGFVTEVYGQMKNSFADEGMGKTRNGVPGDIAGRTENFKPISKYNPFLQRREGTKSLRDPFMAVQEYLQPALYNIHMTEPGARARAVETAFRTAEQLKQMDTRSVATEMESTLKKYQNTSSDNSKLITGFQEYANAVAGKTQRFDRQVTDSSDAAAKSLKVWQGLQRIGGRGTILGNISSILAQPLNQVVGIADAGGINYAKGIAEYMGGDSQIDKSDFIRARETEATKPLRGTGEKILDAGSVPLQAVELASVKLMWHTQHQKALSEGYTGQEAVQQADMNTERLVAGRGIADKPELYRSTVANGVYQYTLEVNAQNKAFWQDLDTKQKVKFMVAASAVNALMGAITGFEPLPDFLKAIFETGKDFIDPEDDRSVARKLGGGVQRMGDEYAGMNPLISAVANILPQDTRKAVFGQDSQLGRFAGGSAPIQVVKNTTNAASKVAKGDLKGAGYDAIRNVPFGNQIRKTVSGAELIARGYSTDKNGKKTFDAPTSIAGKAQVLAFGPSASKNAQGYYNGTGDKITTTDANGNTKVTKTTQSGITVNKTKNYEDAVAGIKSSYGGKYAELTEEEVKELGKTDADAKDYYKTLQAVKQSSKTPDELPTNLNPLATSIYEKEARLTTDGKDKWNKRPSANKEVNNTIKSWLPKGVDAPRITNETTKQWADYEKKKADGTLGKLEEEAVKRTILRSAYNSVLNEDEKDLYTLSEDKLLDAYDRGVINDQNIDKALKVERQLFDAGLISTETLAKKLGLVARGYKGRSGGRGGRGGSGKIAKDTSVAFSNALQSTTLKRLNSLLAGTQSGGSTSRRVATSKPVLKKITVRA